MLRNEIYDNAGLTGIPASFKALESLRLLKLLDGKDTLQLLKTIDTHQIQIEKLEKSLQASRTKISELNSLNEATSQELSTIRYERDVLQRERSEFKKILKESLLDVINKI